MRPGPFPDLREDVLRRIKKSEGRRFVVKAHLRNGDASIRTKLNGFMIVTPIQKPAKQLQSVQEDELLTVWIALLLPILARLNIAIRRHSRAILLISTYRSGGHGNCVPNGALAPPERIGLKDRIDRIQKHRSLPLKH